MKTFIIIFLLFLFPIKVYGKLNNVGVSCPSPDYPNNLNKNSIVLMTFWFKPNYEVLESIVFKNETGVTIQKFIRIENYSEEISFIKWINIHGMDYKLNRESLELTYIGINGKTWKRNCSKFNSEKEMDILLNDYYQNTKIIINQMKKNNKI